MCVTSDLGGVSGGRIHSKSLRSCAFWELQQIQRGVGQLGSTGWIEDIIEKEGWGGGGGGGLGGGGVEAQMIINHLKPLT